jgi:hypothetical protein
MDLPGTRRGRSKQNLSQFRIRSEPGYGQGWHRLYLIRYVYVTEFVFLLKAPCIAG